MASSSVFVGTVLLFLLVSCQGDQCLPGKCSCSTTDIICSGINTSDLKEVGRLIHQSTNFIRITKSNIPELPQNLFQDEDDMHMDICQNMVNLRKLDLSSNEIRTIHGKTFHCMPDLDTLNLSHNEWFINSTAHFGFFTTVSKLRVLNLTNAFLEKINGSIHIQSLEYVFRRNAQDSWDNTNMTSLQELYLGSNEFFIFPKSFSQSLCGFTNLRILDLSYNYISDPYIWGTCTTNIETIDLSNNMMSTVTSEFLGHIKNFKNLEMLDLTNNRFSCRQHLIHFYKWLNETHVMNEKQKNHLLCYRGCGFEGTFVNRPILSLQLKDFDCPEPGSLDGKLQGTYIVLGIMLGIIVIVLTVVLYVKRNSIKTLVHRCPSSWSAPFRISYLSPASHQGYSTVNETV